MRNMFVELETNEQAAVFGLLLLYIIYSLFLKEQSPVVSGRVGPPDAEPQTSAGDDTT